MCSRGQGAWSLTANVVRKMAVGICDSLRSNYDQQISHLAEHAAHEHENGLVTFCSLLDMKWLI